MLVSSHNANALSHKTKRVASETGWRGKGIFQSSRPSFGLRCRSFFSNTSPKCIDPEGLARRCSMTSQVYTGYFKKGVELLLMVLETGKVLVRITLP